MNQKLIESIRKNMDLKNTEELLKIWEENDRQEWSDETFDVVKQLVLDRGEILSPQKEFVKKVGESEIVEVASWGKRLGNFIIDIILYRIAVLLLLIPFADTDFVQWLAKNEGADWLFGIFLLFLYYFVFESAFQKTPAKFITCTKVVMINGSKPDTNTIAKRTLSRFVPFELLSGSKGTWWHDRWTKTRVVRVGKTVVFCPYCGATNPTNAKSCTKCSRTLVGVFKESEYECPKCHSDVPQDAKFCPKCGETFEE